MNQRQATIIMQVLDVMQAVAWTEVMDEMKRKGWQPGEIIDAWKAGEKLAGNSGTAPTIRDFD